MDSATTSRDASELDPWIILLGKTPDLSLQLWQLDLSQTQALAGNEEDRYAIAMFSDQETATDFASRHSHQPWKLQQVRGTELVQLLSTCFQDGLRFIALNPSATEARQVFVIRDILKSALGKLKQDRESNAIL